jgi:hypothetical protein
MSRNLICKCRGGNGCEGSDCESLRETIHGLRAELKEARAVIRNTAETVQAFRLFIPPSQGASPLGVKVTSKHEERVCRIANVNAGSIWAAIVTAHGLTCGDRVDFEIDADGKVRIQNGTKESPVA